MVWRASSICTLTSSLARQAQLFGFLHEDFARDDFFAQLGFHVRRHGTARLGDLLRQRVQARLGNGLAVDDGDVLRHHALGAQGQQARNGGSQ
jgi:hypothetical protein